MRRTIGIEFFSGGQSIIKGSATVGNGETSWTDVPGPIGVHAPMQDDVTGAIRITAGKLRPDGSAYGGIRYDKCVLDFGSPVVHDANGLTKARSVGTAIVLGDDGVRHCIPPRGAVRIRFALGTDPFPIKLGRPRISDAFRIAPGVMVKIPEEMSRWKKLGGFNPFIGNRASYLEIDSGAPGGIQLPIIPGFEDDSGLALDRVDGAGNRHATDCFDPVTGLPAILTTEKYGAWRIWQESGQLERFCVPHELYAYDRRPIWWNDGACPYEASACAIDHYKYPAPTNMEHLWRYLCLLIVAVEQYGDKLARIDQLMVAHDVAYSVRPAIDALVAESFARPGQGHISLGKRETSWPIEALMGGDEYTRAMGERLLLTQDRVIMANGFAIRRFPSIDYGSPGMYVQTADVPDPLPLDVDGGQIMEEIFRCFVAGRWGHVNSARMTLDRMFRTVETDVCMLDRFGYIPHFAGVAQNGVVFRRVPHKAGKPDQFPWWAAALAFYHSRDRHPAIDAMCRIADANGRVGGTVAQTIANLEAADPKEQTIGSLIALKSL